MSFIAFMSTSPRFAKFCYIGTCSSVLISLFCLSLCHIFFRKKCLNDNVHTEISGTLIHLDISVQILSLIKFSILNFLPSAMDRSSHIV